MDSAENLKRLNSTNNLLDTDDDCCVKRKKKDSETDPLSSTSSNESIIINLDDEDELNGQASTDDSSAYSSKSEDECELSKSSKLVKELVKVLQTFDESCLSLKTDDEIFININEHLYCFINAEFDYSKLCVVSSELHLDFLKYKNISLLNENSLFVEEFCSFLLNHIKESKLIKPFSNTRYKISTNGISVNTFYLQIVELF